MARENDDHDTLVAKVVMVAMLNTAQVLEGGVKSLKQLTHVEVTLNKKIPSEMEVAPRYNC